MLDVVRPAVEERVELAVTDDAERDVGEQRGRGEDRVEPVERDQLADEEDVERLGRMPSRPEERLLRADERNLDALLAEAEGPPKERGVRLRVRHDEVGGAEGAAVDELQHARRR